MDATSDHKSELVGFELKLIQITTSVHKETWVSGAVRADSDKIESGNRDHLKSMPFSELANRPRHCGFMKKRVRFGAPQKLMMKGVPFSYPRRFRWIWPILPNSIDSGTLPNPRSVMVYPLVRDIWLTQTYPQLTCLESCMIRFA